MLSRDTEPGDEGHNELLPGDLEAVSETVADSDRAIYRLGYRDAGRVFLAFLGDLYNVRQIYRVGPDYFMACLMAAIGKWDLLHPLQSQSDIAGKYHCTKANTNKLVVEIQTRLKLPTHRSDEGRGRMSKKGFEQRKGAKKS